jgi:hypothetical protein
MRIALLPALSVLLAQATPPGVDALPPWLGVVVQFGSFGLVVYVIVYAAPRWLKEAREERESREAAYRAERKETIDATAAMVEKNQRHSEDRNREIVASIDRQTAEFRQMHKESAARIEQAVANACKGKGQA